MLHQFTPSELARFWAKVDRTGGEDACWPWTAGRRNGYGHFTLSRAGRQLHIAASRVAWMIHAGDIPEGLLVCHDCPGGDNRACVNPRHLFLGSIGENNRDSVRKGRRFKLTPEDVRMARQLAAAGWLQRDIAEKLGVCRENVSYVVRRKSWKCIE